MLKTQVLDLESKGIRIALSSGRPVSYLETLTKRIGLQIPIIVAENGWIKMDVAERKEMWSGERNLAMHEIRARS
jgi:hydroxymethylpyrimidine pyrophosphatase-like HAD family hydrolase